MCAKSIHKFPRKLTYMLIIINDVLIINNVCWWGRVVTPTFAFTPLEFENGNGRQVPRWQKKQPYVKMIGITQSPKKEHLSFFIGAAHNFDLRAILSSQALGPIQTWTPPPPSGARAPAFKFAISSFKRKTLNDERRKEQKEDQLPIANDEGTFMIFSAGFSPISLPTRLQSSIPFINLFIIKRKEWVGGPKSPFCEFPEIHAITRGAQHSQQLARAWLGHFPSPQRARGRGRGKGETHHHYVIPDIRRMVLIFRKSNEFKIR